MLYTGPHDLLAARPFLSATKRLEPLGKGEFLRAVEAGPGDGLSQLGMELHPVASGLVAAFGEDLEGFLGLCFFSLLIIVYIIHYCGGVCKMCPLTGSAWRYAPELN